MITSHNARRRTMLRTAPAGPLLGLLVAGMTVVAHAAPAQGGVARHASLYRGVYLAAPTSRLTRQVQEYGCIAQQQPVDQGDALRVQHPTAGWIDNLLSPPNPCLTGRTAMADVGDYGVGARSPCRVSRARCRAAGRRKRANLGPANVAWALGQRGLAFEAPLPCRRSHGEWRREPLQVCVHTSAGPGRPCGSACTDKPEFMGGACVVRRRIRQDPEQASRRDG
jgi:hypothetical protein